MSAKLQVGLEDGWIKETQMSLQIFTELWKSLMELKCLGAFVFPHCATFRHLDIFGSLPIASSLLPLCLEFVQNYCLSWHLLKQQFIEACWPSRAFFQGDKNKGSKGREARARAERKEGCQACWAVSCWCVSWVTAPVWSSSCPCWYNVFELGALCANEHFHMLRLHWIPRVILDSKILEQVSRRNNTKAYINSAWSAPYVRSLFF